MHKCFKCGAEFEGNFCPECGTQWQENKHCPNCGAMLAGGAKFCNNCGYSFVGKKEPSKVGAFFKKVWLWIKRHAKIVIPTACALIVVIVVCSLIPTFILMSVNGTYYAYSFDENGEMVFNEKTYITLSTGKWTDEEGKEGSYSLSGGEITFTYIDETMKDLGDLFGEDVGPEELKGTVENGVLTVNENGFNRLFVLKSHKHKFGEWETVSGKLCETVCNQKRTCDCKAVETQTVMPTGHNVGEDNICTICGEPWRSTEGLEYKYSSSGYAVNGIGTASGDIVIPYQYKGEPVTEISYEAFAFCSGITSIKIPNSVTLIGSRAFAGCTSLTSITILNGVTSIEYGTFWICDGLTSVTLPDSVTSIGDDAFSGCSGLTSITIPDGVTSIGDWAFSGCSKLTSVTIPDGVTSIGDLAFSDCSGLTSITIPDSVTSIGKMAFDGCKELTSVTIGNRVTSIGERTFYNCNELTSVTIGNSVTSIERDAFSGCNKLTSIYYTGDIAAWCGINELYSLTGNGRTLYINGKEVTGDLVIPDSVTSIGNSAFEDCNKLTSVTIGNSVTSIGNRAFSGCKELMSVTIGNSVTSIGANAFSGCSGLTSITYNGTKTQWKAIEKGSYWNYNTGNYTVQCTDGKLDQDGNEIE